MKGNTMDERIIYQNDAGGVAIITPCDCGLTIEQIAAKDVPTGNGATNGPLTKRT